jgi:hypothetical protein
MRPKLRFSLNDIGTVAQRYPVPLHELDLMALRPQILRRGHLTGNELRDVAYWKAPRSAGHARKNSDEYVRDITQFALGVQSERARIQALTLLDGVSWPTASVILHLFHRDPYPILDFRALWSASLDVPSQYTFGFWRDYLAFCRRTAVAAGVDMRTLDRAMWQYSKENQPRQNGE